MRKISEHTRPLFCRAFAKDVKVGMLLVGVVRDEQGILQDLYVDKIVKSETSKLVFVDMSKKIGAEFKPKDFLHGISGLTDEQRDA